MSQQNNQFGVAIIYPTTQNGRTWFNKWGQNAVTKIYTAVNPDDDDTEVHYHGSGQFTVYGSSDTGNGSYPTGYEHSRAGFIEMHGAFPRIYIRTNDLIGYDNSLKLTI